MFSVPIVQAGEPVLRKRTRQLTPEELADVPTLIEIMRDTMRAAPGVGLAAPQIGLGLAVAVVEDRPDYQTRLDNSELAARGREPVPFYALINPRLTIVDPTPVEHFEGCLSVEGYMAIVPRARSVRVDALGLDGKPVVIEATGWHARILQHELDHLDGVLYIDRMYTRTFSRQI
jgi:peptide deformylase